MRSKLINGTNMLMSAGIALTSLAVGYWNSFKNNDSHHDAQAIAQTVTQIVPDPSSPVNITSLATNTTRLANDLFYRSRVQGIVNDAVLYLLVLPSFLESLGHHAARNGMAIGTYVSENWDYIVGRALQTGGLTLTAVGIHEDGARNPQLATAYAGAAPVVLGAGTYFVERNRAKHAAAAAIANGNLERVVINQGNPSAPGVASESEGYNPPGFRQGFSNQQSSQ